MKHLAIALLISGVAAAQEPAKPKPVHAFLDKTNLALFSADALVRSLDAQSTRAKLTNPCHCFYENQLPSWIAGSTPRMYTYSLAVTGAVVGGAWILHKTRHHKLERLLPIADTAWDGGLVICNWSHEAPKPLK